MVRDNEFDEPVPKRSNALWWVLGCGGLLLLGLGCGAPLLFCGGLGMLGMNEIAKQDKRVTDEPGLAVTAVDLSQAFKGDAPAAHSRYEDKVLLVTGVIAKKVSDDDIELTGVADGKPITCTASVNKSDLFKLVAVGDTVEVKGIGTVSLSGDIELESCGSVQKTKKTK